MEIIDDLIRLFDEYYEEKSKAKHNAPKYKEGHIFDEDKSVKWNREELSRVNTLIDTDNKAKQKEHFKNAKNIYEQIISKITEEYKINRKVAEIIYRRAEADGSESVYHMCCRISDFVELYDQFMEATKEN